jgi:aryl-alcohol dehydrogenase-like predicted oxidoreductase
LPRCRLGLISEQCIYSLADRTPELEVIPAAQHFGLGLIPWSPLGGGMLAGILQKPNEGRRAGEWAQKKLEKHRDAVQKFEALCAEIGQQPADVALAWVLANPAITAPIVGPRTMDQFKAALAVLEMKLDEKVMTRLDVIWPGPGGAAPEAYSW